MSEFGHRLSELRKNADLKQNELAIKLQYAESTISNFETGQRRANEDVIKRIADFFDVSTDYLLGKTDVKQSVDSLYGDYINGKKLGEVIEKLLALDDSRRKVLLTLLDDMVFSSKARKQGGRSAQP